MKKRYLVIILYFFSLFSTLKEEIKSKEEKLERNEQLLATVQSENKKLAEPLRKAKEQLVELQRQLGSQEKEKGALISATSKLKVSQKKVESLSWEVEVLQQKYDRAISKFFNLCYNYRLTFVISLFSFVEKWDRKLSGHVSILYIQVTVMLYILRYFSNMKGEGLLTMLKV